jgi:hypothetical protein
MAIFTKQFETEDDYEHWLARAGDVRVISIKSREAPPTRSGLRGKHQMTVTYAGTSGGHIAAGRNTWLLALEFIAVILVLYGVIGYTMRAGAPEQQAQVPFRLDRR